MKTLIIITFLIGISLTQNCCLDNTVSVSGNAEVKVKADIAKFTVNVQDTQSTTSAALNQVNTKIASIVRFLNQNGLSQDDYSTSSFSINSEYDYSSGERILTGQRASQSLTITVREITSDGAFIGKLIRGITSTKGATINGVNFQQSDERLGVKQARKAAYEAARAKAQQYARFSGLTLRNALRIQSINGGNTVPFFASQAAFRTSQQAQTLVPVRDVTVSASVNVVFSLLP